MRAKALWGGVSVSVVLRVGVAVGLGNAVTVLPGIWDQQSYHTLAQRHGFTFEAPWWPATPAGEPTAHWSYLYTLMLAAFYSVFGPAPLMVWVGQAVAAGALMPWLAYRVAACVFRPASNAEALGLVAAGWTALYGYFMYYAPALMTESLYLVAVLWVLDCGLRLIARGQDIPARQWMELGLALALTAMLRQVFLVCAPFLFLWLWLALKPQQGSRFHSGTLGLLARGGLIIGAVMIALFAPFTLYNYIPIYFEFWPAPESSLPSNLTRTASFGLALPFMVAGAALWAGDSVRALTDRRTGGLLFLFAALYSLVHILSWSLIRYRLPVDAALLPFAARALWPALSWARGRGLRLAAAAR